MVACFYNMLFLYAFYFLFSKSGDETETNTSNTNTVQQPINDENNIDDIELDDLNGSQVSIVSEDDNNTNTTQQP